MGVWIKAQFPGRRKYPFSLGALVGPRLFYAKQNATDKRRPYDHIRLQAMLMAQKSVFRWMNVTANLGVYKSDAEAQAAAFGVINIAFNLGENIGLFIEDKETINFENNSFTERLLDGGLSWLLAPDFQVDLYGGWVRQSAFNRISESVFINGGISWRIKAKPTKTTKS